MFEMIPLPFKTLAQGGEGEGFMKTLKVPLLQLRNSRCAV